MKPICRSCGFCMRLAQGRRGEGRFPKAVSREFETVEGELRKVDLPELRDMFAYLLHVLPSLLCCLIPYVLMMVLAAVLGTRTKARFAEAIRQNQRAGLYNNPRFVRRMRMVIVADLLIVGALAGDIIFIMFTRSQIGIVIFAAVILCAAVLTPITIITWSKPTR